MAAYGIHNARIRQEDGSMKSLKESFEEMKRTVATVPPPNLRPVATGNPKLVFKRSRSKILHERGERISKFRIDRELLFRGARTIVDGLASLSAIACLFIGGVRKTVGPGIRLRYNFNTYTTAHES
jgi:hypothetical protein